MAFRQRLPCKFQFTPLREGRRVAKCEPRGLAISIHAPPRGATTDERRKRPGRPISIHAPPRGATRLCVAVRRVVVAFQFTPLREGRQRRKKWYRDATRFQFTPLREGRRRRPATARTHAQDFNSRPSARGDLCGFPTTFALQISIHAPPRGATAKDMQFLQIFCSTLTNQHGLTIVPRNLSRLFW